jgi:carotenoid cleavage dioxygenase
VAADHAPLLERAFERAPREASYRVARVEGEVPAWLRGVYYLNGPARFERAGLRYRHWLDGDGMVCALRFAGAGVDFTARYVRGTKLAAEEEAGRPLYRAFGTAFPGDRLKRGIGLETPANVSVYRFGELLLAGGEQGLPWELEPETLRTRGEWTAGRALNEVSPFSAHAKVDDATDELYNFGVSYAARQPTLQLYRIGRQGLVWRRRVPLPYPATIHDFALGREHIAVYVSPYLLDVETLMRNGATVLEALSWRPELGSRLLVLARDSGELLASVPVGERYVLHLNNCFAGDGRLNVEVIELERPVYPDYTPVPDLFADAPFGEPVRLTLDLGDWRLLERRTIAYRSCLDFPSIDRRRLGEPAGELWLLGISSTGRPGRKFFDQLAHLSWETGRPAGVWQAPAGCHLCGEPAFAPDPGDDRRGAVIVQLFDAERRAMAFLVFDAHHVAAGPVAKLWLEEPVHLGFHAAFYPD